MSPTEDDLRAALRRGEGDAPDPGRVVAYGQAARGRRRAQVRAGVLGVAVVAVVGVGGSLLVSTAGRDTGASSAAAKAQANRPAAAPSAFGSARAPVAGAASGTPTAGPACPATLPRYLLPGGGSPGQFGASGPLFAKPVTSVVVCGYGAAGSIPVRVVLAGAQAKSLVDSLESASKTPVPALCPAQNEARQRQLAIIGRTPGGESLPAVTATLGSCNTQVTNGTALRYGWTPPTELDEALGPLRPAPPTAHGSPLRS